MVEGNNSVAKASLKAVTVFESRSDEQRSGTTNKSMASRRICFDLHLMTVSSRRSRSGLRQIDATGPVCSPNFSQSR